mgnify:CR=1 FL=1
MILIKSNNIVDFYNFFDTIEGYWSLRRLNGRKTKFELYG